MAKKRKRSQKQLRNQAQAIVSRIVKKWTELESKGYISYKQDAFMQAPRMGYAKYNIKRTREINLNIPQTVTSRDIKRLQKAEKNIKWYFKGGYLVDNNTGEAIFVDVKHYEVALRKESAQRGAETRKKNQAERKKAREKAWKEEYDSTPSSSRTLEDAYEEDEKRGKSGFYDDSGYPEFEESTTEYDPFDPFFEEHGGYATEGEKIAENFISQLGNAVIFNWRDSSGGDAWYMKRQSVINKVVSFLKNAIANERTGVLKRIEQNADRLNAIIDEMTSTYLDDGGESDANEFLSLIDSDFESLGDEFYAGY